MKPTFTPKAVPRRPKLACHDCGASSDVHLVADTRESGTGYLDELNLCRACLKERERKAHQWITE